MSRNPRGRGGQRGRGGHGVQQTNARLFDQPGSNLNEKATKCEDGIISTKPENAFRSLKLNDDTFQPQRPAFGTQGLKVILFANYFELTKIRDVPFHRYSISVPESVAKSNPSSIPKGQKLKRLIQLLVGEQLQNQVVITDYKSNIITSTKITDGQTNERTFSVVYREDARSDQNPRTYKFVVQHNATLDSGELLDYLLSSSLDSSEPVSKLDIIQAMNIMVGNGLKGASTIVSQAQKYFSFAQNAQESCKLGFDIDCLRGYLFSVRSATARILLNVQVKHAAFYQPQSLSALYITLGIQANSSEDSLKKVEHRIKGLKVKVTHFRPQRNKKILGFARPGDGASQQNPPKIPYVGAPANRVQFWVEGDKGGKGSYVTVAEYFHRQYNLKKSNLPVVNTGSRGDPKYTIAEVCQIPTGVSYAGRLDGPQTANMINFAVRQPTDNAGSITGKGFNFIETYSLQNLRAFGWDVNNRLIQVEGRILPSPMVAYAKNRRVNVRDGSWNLMNTELANVTTLPKWSMIWITMNKKVRPVEEVNGLQNLNQQVRDFAKSVGERGLKNSLYIPGIQHDLDSNSVLEGLSELRERFRKQAANPDGIRLILVLLPSDPNTTTIYNAVKRAGDIDFGIHTVCAQIGKFYKHNNDQYYQNIALKINLKLGGRNQELSGADLDFITEGKTMLVGLDVTHPAPGEDKAPSIACIVASVDKYCAQFPAYTHIQPARKEMVEVVKTMLMNRLSYWREKNRTLPDQLLIYRDGVSEGQYAQVRSKELSEIREACKEMYSAAQTKDGLPRITIVIVGKRHHTRFFPASSAGADKNGNIKNGTIVDRGVTEARIWDFYLSAHTAIKGTARPAHYVVVHDEIFRRRAQMIRPDPRDRRSAGQRATELLESITHHLCYLYGRATKAVSICPPAYYADIGCERARRWMSRFYSDYAASDTTSTADAEASEVTVHPRLENTMYYI